MRSALHAEWTKLRTVAAPAWLLLGMIAATVALSAVATSVVTCGPSGCGGDPARTGLLGVQLGQALAAILGVLVVSGEFSSGMFRTTLTAIPRRATVLTAKAVTLTGAVAVAATAAVLGSLLAGRLILHRRGFPAPAPALSDGPVLRATTGSILYLTLIALLALGVAAVLRDSATSIGVVLALLYLLPILAQAIGDPHWQRLLERTAPMSAGLTVQATTDLDSLPLSPWAGLGVTAAWAAAALVVGGLSTARRDI
ncbi:ABC transporter permease subunit [Actinoplanes sp. NBRC 103695]|uniref:ABC transporter permease subunit n=1 Tax=Actinoplanes sp. NBRC 103695 TaxID=3032202 RepID=UPI0024A1C949|nr:ABC transporter permease subunit [Actinoplanes sp. NBRC 103695]GLY98639.1 ABC transporter [Actinoplanes sp. NBRC 103695]